MQVNFDCRAQSLIVGHLQCEKDAVLGACCPYCVVVPPPDAVVGRRGPRAPGSCQSRVGFSEHLPIGSPPIADGIATSGCAMKAGDNLVRGATSGTHSQPATEESTGCVREAMVQESIKLGSALQP